MKYGILADIHANLEALRAVLEFLAGKTDGLIVLGDVVGYGPDPEECCRRLAEAGALCIKGNHEDAVLTGDHGKFTPDAAASLVWTADRLSPGTRDMLRGWPDWLEEGNMLFVHGSPADPLFGYIKTPAAAFSAFASLSGALCFHGHTHFPCGYCKSPDGEKAVMIPADFNGTLTVEIEMGFQYLVNAGSVGQPRDGIPAACAGIYDTEAKVFQLHRVLYPAETTRDKILAAGLPSSLAARLVHGV